MTHNGASIVRAPDAPATVHAAIDRHPTLGVDGPNLAIGARLNRSSAPGGTGRRASRRMVARVSGAIPALGSPTISTLGSSTISTLGSSTVSTLGSPTITRLVSASAIATGLAAAVSGALTSPVASVSAGSPISATCAARSTVSTGGAAGSTIHSRGAAALAGVSARMLRRGGMLRRSRMGCRSGMGSGRAAMFLRRSDCGDGENNQQYGPFTQNLFL
ncbi:MAG: hypothetical protein ACLPMG_13780 [Terriglobales bacterium]